MIYTSSAIVLAAVALNSVSARVVSPPQAREHVDISATDGVSATASVLPPVGPGTMYTYTTTPASQETQTLDNEIYSVSSASHSDHDECKEKWHKHTEKTRTVTVTRTVSKALGKGTPRSRTKTPARPTDSRTITAVPDPTPVTSSPISPARPSSVSAARVSSVSAAPDPGESMGPQEDPEEGDPADNGESLTGTASTPDGGASFNASLDSREWIRQFETRNGICWTVATPGSCGGGVDGRRLSSAVSGRLVYETDFIIEGLDFIWSPARLKLPKFRRAVAKIKA
ncbi:hypothetical protein FB451DRAFT_1377850 [Mycena latifolia]|nr:hypothetical protein FB451DRAFT_1377850 [Mycena latifolia]